MHKVKDGSSVNTISNISTPKRSLNMGSFGSVISNKSGSEFNKAIDISISSGAALRRSSRVPKLINLDSRDYESIAKPSVLKCNSSETDASVQSSIVLSIKNSSKQSQAASKKNHHNNQVKDNFCLRNALEPVLLTNSNNKNGKKGKKQKTQLESHNQYDKENSTKNLRKNSSEIVENSISSVIFTGKKRNKNSDSTNSNASNAVKERKRQVESILTEQTESCQGLSYEERPKKKKVPVLPENEAIINSYVKYQEYFNETTQRTCKFLLEKEKDKSQEISTNNKQDYHKQGNLELNELQENKFTENNSINESNPNYNMSNDIDYIKASHTNNKSNLNVNINKFSSNLTDTKSKVKKTSKKTSKCETNSNSNLDICSNKTVQSQSQSDTKLENSLLHDLRCLKAKDLNLSVSEALTGNRTISTMASLDMDIINSLTQYRTYSINNAVKSRSVSKNKNGNQILNKETEKKPTIFNIVKTTNCKKPLEKDKTKSKLNRRDSNTKSKFLFLLS